MDDHHLSSAEARLLVLEMSVAALIAQLPRQSLDEVASMLCFIADVTEDTGEIVSSIGERQLGHVSHWAGEMLHRVMASRKASRVETPASALVSDA
jgi:hypothetical protein